jgi:FKBP-type peptidyl-prolyl cis-trans isomerase FklB
MDTTSYSVGLVIAKNLKAQGINNLDQASFSQAFTDVFEGNDVALSIDEANKNFKMLIEKQKSILDLSTKKEGDVFLAENAKRPEVKTTHSGLQYEVLEAAQDSDESPNLTDKVRVHYHGTLIDGTVFDSSIDRNEPISFPLNGVIAGWQEGLQLMKVGSKFRFFIPHDLAYGSNAAGPVIKPYSTLIFDVILLGIE